MHCALESAFRRTRYRVRAKDGELLLHVDRIEPGLAGLMSRSGARCAALLTAFNPDGRRQVAFRNRQAQRQLQRELAQTGCFTLVAGNEDPRGLWPTEPSLLVLDLSLDHARQFAARYGQVAFLWMEADGTPRLIETAAPGQRT